MSDARAGRIAPPTRLGRRLDLAWRRVLPRGTRILAALVAVTVVLGLGIGLYPGYVPLVTLLVPLVVASLLLGPRQLPWLVMFVLLVLVAIIPAQPAMSTRIVITLTVIFGLGLMVLFASFRRSTLGVGGAQGESMFVDLRDRIMRQGGIPPLPEEWYATWELRSAGGTPFAGDFIVSARVADRLDVVVVDVSGKGENAGTRALLLSGAFGGLLGALPSGDFLEAANDFLLRQDWDEGFATAVHFSLDLATGDYRLRSAGHPPAAVREAGTGRWRVVETEGPVLGIIPGAWFATERGTLHRGDAVLLYTDGLVETPRRDIAMGIDRMLGQAEQLLRGDFEDGARRLVDALGSHNDDWALLLVQRR